MIHGAAKLLTLLSVLFHAGVGCCAHHDHCSALKSTPPAVKKQENDPCSCKFHTHCDAVPTSENAGDDEPDHSSCPCGESHGDCSDHCSWLTNSRVELPADFGVVLPLAAVDVWSLRASNRALISSRFLHGPPLVSELTDTLRAATQVWRL